MLDSSNKQLSSDRRRGNRIGFKGVCVCKCVYMLSLVATWYHGHRRRTLNVKCQMGSLPLASSSALGYRDPGASMPSSRRSPTSFPSRPPVQLSNTNTQTHTHLKFPNWWLHFSTGDLRCTGLHQCRCWSSLTCHPHSGNTWVGVNPHLNSR